MLEEPTAAPPTGARLVLVNAGASVLALLALGAAFVVFDSRLALAQAADSLSDVVVAVALLVSVRVAAQPPDADHPIGHHNAEPVAALLAAVAAGILAVEVVRTSIEAIVAGARPDLAWPLLLAFVAKAAFKAVVAVLARRADRRHPSPALRALALDARNDVLVGILSVGGYFLARTGMPEWDAWLALPVGAWIGWSGIDLARENIGFLMGQAPDADRREALRRMALEVEGVRSVHGMRARYHGSSIDVLVHVVVDPELTLRRAHDIGEAVEARLVGESDVCHAVAHVDVEDDGPPPPPE